MGEAKYRVELSDEEREHLRGLVAGGRPGSRKLKRAQILLAADRGLSNAAMAAAIQASVSTVYRTKRRFVEEGFEQALAEEARGGGLRKLSESEEATLVALACSEPPAGRCRWTMELLAGAMVRLTDHDSLSRETVRRRLKENKIKPWQKKMWCIPKVDAQFVARMESVLDLYTQPASDSPVVCFDETPYQLIGETRTPLPARVGQVQRYDYEYRRNGVVNLFVFVDAHRPWREVKVTARRTRHDFSERMRDLVDLHYPAAERIRVVLDNLSIHRPSALYESFEPGEARRILRRLEFHYTPKHASWLNMVELEIGTLRKQCLDRRIPDVSTLQREVATWVDERNRSGARIQWLFDVRDARRKLGRAYPQIRLPEAA